MYASLELTFPDNVKTPRPIAIILEIIITRLLNNMLKFSGIMLALKENINKMLF